MGYTPHYATADAALDGDLATWTQGGFVVNADSIGFMDWLLDVHGEGWMDGFLADPPYGIEFLRDWDSFKAGKGGRHIATTEGMGGYAEEKGFAAGLRFANQGPADMLSYMQFSYEWASRAFRLAKPGARIAVFSSTRTYHWMGVGLDMAGWECFDKLEWVYWQGFSKSHDYGKAMRRRYELAFGLRGPRPKDPPLPAEKQGPLRLKFRQEVKLWQGKFAPATKGMPWDEVLPLFFAYFDGKGHDLKPAHEPIYLGWKPSKDPHHRSGFWLNIDKCRIPYRESKPKAGLADHLQEPSGEVKSQEIAVHYPHASGERWENPREWLRKAEEQGETVTIGGHPAGRFPTNLMIERDHLSPPAGVLDEQVSGDSALDVFNRGTPGAGYTRIERDHLNPPEGDPQGTGEGWLPWKETLDISAGQRAVAHDRRLEADHLAPPSGEPPENQISGFLEDGLYGKGDRAAGGGGYTHRLETDYLAVPPFDAPPSNAGQCTEGNQDGCWSGVRSWQVEADHLAPPAGEPGEVLGHDFSQHGGSMMTGENRGGTEKNAHYYAPHPGGRFPTNIVLPSQVGAEQDHLDPPGNDRPVDRWGGEFAVHDGSMMVKETSETGDYGRHWVRMHEEGRFPRNLLLAGQIGLSDDISIPITSDLLTELGLAYLDLFLADMLDNQEGLHPIDMYRCPKPVESEHGAWNGHITIKPEGLMRWLAQLLFNPAEHAAPANVIMDPFCGSGPTPRVAEELGLRWIGSDLDPDSCGWTTMRLRRYQKGLSTLPAVMQARFDAGKKHKSKPAAPKSPEPGPISEEPEDKRQMGLFDVRA